MALGPLRRGLWLRHVSGPPGGDHGKAGPNHPNAILSPCSWVYYRTLWQCADSQQHVVDRQQGQSSPGADSSRTNPGSLKENLLENVCGNQMGPRPRRASPRAARSGNDTEFSQKACFSSLLKLGPPAHGPEQGRGSRGQEGHPFEGRARRNSTEPDPSHVGPAQGALGPEAPVPRGEERPGTGTPALLTTPPHPIPIPANSCHRHPGPLPTH